jgi:hypothetical protein
MHRTTKRFWNLYSDLPSDIQQLANKNFAILQRDLNHPSLHFKKVGKFWSARVGSSFRVLAVQDGEDYIWVWIGSHDEYEKLL